MMNKLLHAILVTLAVGLLVIPLAIVFNMALLPFFISFVVVIGLLDFLNLKGKANEISHLNELIDGVGKEVIDLNDKNVSQAQLAYSVSEKILSTIEGVNSALSKLSEKIMGIDDLYERCNNSILQTSQEIKKELKTVTETLTTSLDSINVRIKEASVNIGLEMENGQKSQITHLKDISEKIDGSIHQSTYSMLEAVKNLIAEMKLELTAISGVISTVSGNLSEDITKDALEFKNLIKDQKQGIESKLELIRNEMGVSSVSMKDEILNLGLTWEKMITDVTSTISSVVTEQSSEIKVISDEIGASIMLAASNVHEVLKEHLDTFSNISSSIQGEIEDGIQHQLNIQEEIRENVKTTLDESYQNQIKCFELITKLQSIQTQFENEINSQRSVIEESVKKVNAQILDAFQGFSFNLKNVNEDLSKELARHFKGMLDSIEDLPDNVEDAFKSSVGSSIEDMGLSIINLQEVVAGLDKYGEYLSRYEEQLNVLAKSETSIMNQFEKIIKGKR